MDETLGIVAAKSVMTYFADKIPAMEKTVAREVCNFALGRIQGRIVSFEEQVMMHAWDVVGT